MSTGPYYDNYINLPPPIRKQLDQAWAQVQQAASEAELIVNLRAIRVGMLPQFVAEAGLPQERLADVVGHEFLSRVRSFRSMDDESWRRWWSAPTLLEAAEQIRVGAAGPTPGPSPSAAAALIAASAAASAGTAPPAHPHWAVFLVRHQEAPGLYGGKVEGELVCLRARDKPAARAEAQALSRADVLLIYLLELASLSDVPVNPELVELRRLLAKYGLPAGWQSFAP